MPVSRPPATSGPCQSGTTQSGDSSELAARLPCKGKSVRNRGVSQTMPFLVIPRSLLRGGFIAGLIPNIKENPRNRKTPKRGRKRLFNEAIHALRMRVERTFAWEDTFKRLLLRFEH